MRKKIIVGNWKMHLNAQQASILVHRLQERIDSHRDVDVVLAPSMLHVQPLSTQIDRRKFKLAAQNAYFVDEGAFTGEVSASMLADLVQYVIIGHSERRYIFGERDSMIAKKVAAVQRNGMRPILCVGETSQDKSAGDTKRVLHDQLATNLRDITSTEVKNLVVAYEPVWAISDGKNFRAHKTPKPNEVKEASDAIRHNVKAMFGRNAEQAMQVLYGGSVTADNADSYLNIEGIDGLLVGGASLNYEQFSSIVEQAHKRLVQG